MDDLQRPATEHEIDQMRDQLAEALDAGVVGMSTGLAYEPAKPAPTSEVLKLAELLGPAGALYTTHLRNEGNDILIMARTDANWTDGIEEAIDRCNAFREIGVDITFLEAPLDKDQMRRYCKEVDGPKMANMVEQGDTPYLLEDELGEMGYKIAIYPVSMMLASIKAMEGVLANLKAGKTPEGQITFPELRDIVGFPEYYEAEKKYAAE